MHLACRHGYHEIVKILLRYKAAVNPTKYYVSHLYIASESLDRTSMLVSSSLGRRHTVI